MPIRSSRKVQQGELALDKKRHPNWGGRRPGAGRKPKGPRPMGTLPAVPHHKREEIERRHPVHVTLRMVKGVWNLRSRRAFRVLQRALLAAHTDSLRLTHFSIQGNHLHLILETENRTTLSLGMRSLAIRAAKGLNKMMGRKGRVIADRYHVRVLRTPRQVRNAINYVLSNYRKHLVEFGEKVGKVTLDEYAAGPAEHVPPTMKLRPSPLLLEPRTWLLKIGWSRAPAPRPILEC